MTRQLVLNIAICTMLGILSVLSIHWMSGYSRQQGGFYRLYPPNPVLLSETININQKLNYIAGAVAGEIYLGHTTDPTHLTAVKPETEQVKEVTIDIKLVEPLNFYSVQVRIDSPYFYYSDGSIPFLHQGLVSNWKVTEILQEGAYFQDIVALDSGAFAIRIISQSKKENVLGKMQPEENDFQLNYGLLEKQVDGIFCTDGMLLYDKYLHRIIYLYYYRNELLVMMPDLSLEFKGNTIDTVSTAQIQTSTLQLEGQTSNQLAVPPPIVNQHSVAYKGWLFVHSNIMAENEELSTFEASDVIDVYDLVNHGKYVFSFHLPHHEQERLGTFSIHDETLIALYQDAIDTYQLNPKYFPREHGYNNIQQDILSR